MDVLLLIVGIVLLVFSDTRRAGFVVLTIACAWLALETAIAWWFFTQLMEVTGHAKV